MELHRFGYNATKLSLAISLAILICLPNLATAKNQFEFRYMEFYNYFSGITDSDMDEAIDVSSLFKKDEKMLLKILGAREEAPGFGKYEVRMRIRTSRGRHVILVDDQFNLEVNNRSYKLKDKGARLRQYVRDRIPTVYKYLHIDNKAGLPSLPASTSTEKIVGLVLAIAEDRSKPLVYDITSLLNSNRQERLNQILSARLPDPGSSTTLPSPSLLEVQFESGRKETVLFNFSLLTESGPYQLTPDAAKCLSYLIFAMLPSRPPEK